MNDIYIYGGRKKQRELVEDVVNWCIQRLMPRYKTLDIEVNLKKIPDAEGYCLSVTNREFQIEIDKTIEKEDDFVTCIIHEMVHVWQYASGVAKAYCNSKLAWKGRDYTNTPYSKQPWERQAYRMQETLYDEWKYCR